MRGLRGGIEGVMGANVLMGGGTNGNLEGIRTGEGGNSEIEKGEN